ncbi:putative toxin-antitoxin system toxin component, PIN family [Noviherbaspirillum denitrificans]|uniref:Toxin n=1 Tax=Noviherbaspirillum denitrificans TaxID=1968433 RepID=A0A254TG25_9BURK|nr:putative toxin-antitoxin system toxin component, PIN family [Noviherbaspirillum denitrificans]OWW21611.1 toxin [Noviherbaspirillum denitrificans]
MIPKRIVIDTNVCLDLFVFRDPRWAALLAALKDGSVRAVTRDDCRKEWMIVLDYPHLPLDADSRPRAQAEFDALIECLPQDALASHGDIPLPVCKDPDDQKFLELSRDAGAQLLITKDKALLKLGRRTARAGLFEIIPPDKWLSIPGLG